MSSNRCVTIVLLSAIAAGCHAQARGRVLDMETNRPVVGADVYINPKGRVKTDARGYFVIDKPFHSVTFSHVGYASRSLEAKEVKDSVWLLPKTHQLNEVVVTAVGPKIRFVTGPMGGKAWEYKKPSDGGLSFDLFSAFSFKKNKQAKRRKKIKEILDKY